MEATLNLTQRRAWHGAKKLPWLVALFSVPFLMPYHWLPQTSFYVYWSALAIGAVAVPWAWRPASSARPLIAWVPLLLIGVLVAQQLLGMIGYFQWFVIAIASLFVAWGAMVAGAQVERGDLERVVVTVAWTILCVSLAQCVWAGVQVAGYELNEWDLIRRPDPNSLRVGGLLAQPNMLSVYLVWGLMAAFYLHQTQRLDGRIAAALALGFMCVLAMAGSRATYLYLGILGPALSAVMWRAGRKPGWWLPLLVPFAYVAVAFAVRSLAQILFSGVDLRPMELSTAGIRIALISDAWKIFLQAPLLGEGWGSFAGARFALPAPSMLELNNRDAHNIVMQLLAETGLAGCIVVVLGLILWAWRALRQPFDAQRVFLIGLTGVTAIYSMVEFPLWMPPFLIVTAWMLGALDPVRRTTAATKPLVKMAAVASGVLVLGIWLAALDYMRVERQYKRFFGFVDEPVPPVLSVLELSNHTLFRLEAEELYLRMAGVDPMMQFVDGPIAENYFKATARPELVTIHAANLVFAGRHEEAVHTLVRICQSNRLVCGFVKEDLARWAETLGDDFVALEARVQSNLGEAERQTPERVR